MMMDRLLKLSDAQDLSAMNATDTVLSEKSIDLKTLGSDHWAVDDLGNSIVADFGKGKKVEVLVQVPPSEPSS
jgi:hypothetical protein